MNIKEIPMISSSEPSIRFILQSQSAEVRQIHVYDLPSVFIEVIVCADVE